MHSRGVVTITSQCDNDEQNIALCNGFFEETYTISFGHLRSALILCKIVVAVTSKVGRWFVARNNLPPVRREIETVVKVSISHAHYIYKKNKVKRRSLTTIAGIGSITATACIMEHFWTISAKPGVDSLDFFQNWNISSGEEKTTFHIINYPRYSFSKVSASERWCGWDVRN